MRLFFALWPDERVRATLSAWARECQSVAAGRATQARNLHMTLAFIGEVDPAALAQYSAAADAVAMQPCVLTLDRCEWWRHNRIVHAGGEAPAALLDAVKALRASLAARNLSFDAKAFVPHVTLLRQARPAEPLPQPQPLHWAIDRFVLVSSERDTSGLAYRIAAGPFGRPL